MMRKGGSMDKKAKARKAAAKKTGARKVAKRSPVKSAKPTKAAKGAKAAKAQPKKATAAKSSAAATTAAIAPSGDRKLTFNHAMIYVKDVERALRFYDDLMGFKLIEDFRYEGTPVYARLRAPGGDGTIALHQAGPGASLVSEGVRLYFEVRDLDDFCRKLQQKGFYITQMPRMMEWGWRHAYLNDPDGHEISLYWAGENRMKKSVMQAARAAAKG
jgi:catechol 2,3-dioxygenase-like lactoylglutathione lyase family enzyme